MQGKFITFEGPDGCGKSTQLRLLAEVLLKEGIEFVTTREPGGSPGAEEIRRLLVEGGADRWDGMTELLLHFAARRDHVERVIKPALARGTWVLSDRFVDSSIAYQGFGYGLGRMTVEQLWGMALDRFVPDLTVVLDVPVEVGLKRAAARRGTEDRYEQMDIAFHERVRKGFLALAHSSRCVLLDATRPVGEIASDIAALPKLVAWVEAHHEALTGEECQP